MTLRNIPPHAVLLLAALGQLAPGPVRGQPQDAGSAAAPAVPSAFEQAPAIVGRVDPATYRVGPGDELALRLTNAPEPLRRRVGPTGHLDVPRLGPMAVAGLTLTELEARLRGLLAGRTPTGPLATLERPRRFRLLVVGEVERPGPVTLQAPARASEAVAAAGGAGPSGARRGIRVLRGGDTLHLDLTRLERAGDLEGDPLVFESDVIHVPARGRFVELLGAVPHPGRFDLIAGDRLSDLVTLGGGTLPQAALAHAELTRVDARGLPVRRAVVLEEALRDPEGPEDLALADGDRLYIPEQAHWRHGARVEVEGEVVRPGPYPIVEGVDRVRSLLERAGGFTDFAERPAVRVERRIGEAPGDSILRNLTVGRDSIPGPAPRASAAAANGSRQALSADVGALLERGDESGNALLLDGDRIVVPRHRPIVSVQGAVRAPGYVRWVPGRSLWEYVRDAGGATRRANRRQVRVIVATTGQPVEASEVQEIRPEDVIWVPAKRERSTWQLARELLAATASAATFWLVIRETTRSK